MLQATKNKYGIETLKTSNVLYDYEHWLTQEDVDMADRYVELVEQTRLEITPQTGDRLIYLSRHGSYYDNAFIGSMGEKRDLLPIYEQPCIPFVWQSTDNTRLSVSGRAFHHVKTDDLKFNGWTEEAPRDWGHCGPRAHGSVIFMAKVPQWIYRGPEPLYDDFTTKTYRRFYLHKDLEARDLYQSLDIAFHSEGDFRQPLQDYEGTVFRGNRKNQIAVRYFHRERVFPSLSEWEKADIPAVKRGLNFHPEQAKIVKDMEKYIAYFHRI